MSAKLPSEDVDNEFEVACDFKASDHYNEDEDYSYDFEHGQWWVTELGTGRQWAVVDVIRGEVDCFEFEQVSEGDPQ